MATYDTIALSAEQRDLAKKSRKWLTLDSSKKSKYVFLNTSEQLYRSLLRVVLENLQNRNPNFNEVIKITTYLNKNQPLSVNHGHTTVAIQLPDDETGIVVKVRDLSADPSMIAFNWEPGDACFLPKGCVLTAPDDAIIDMWIFFLKDSE